MVQRTLSIYPSRCRKAKHLEHLEQRVIGFVQPNFHAGHFVPHENLVIGRSYFLFWANHIVCSLDIAFSESKTNFENVSSVLTSSASCFIKFNSEVAVV